MESSKGCFARSLVPPNVASGPGWFDSSLDLRQGLEVREAGPADMPLTEWLETFMRGTLALV